MEKKELYKKAREYLGKTVSYGIGNIEFDYDRPDGKEYIYEESQDDEDMENFAVMDFLEDLLVDFISQELDKAREEGKREALEQIQRVMEDEMLVIARDGTDILEKHIEEWLSKFSKKL